MLEKQGLFDAMRRSAKLVTGSWWRILGIQLLTLVLITAVSFVVSLPATAVSALVSGGDTLTDPAAATTWTSRHQRHRLRAGLDRGPAPQRRHHRPPLPRPTHPP